MIRTDRRTVIIVIVLVVVAGSAALAVHLMGGSKGSGDGLAKPVHRAAASTSEDAESTAERSFDDYKVVSQRNVFNPLVREPQDAASLTVSAQIPSPTGSQRPSSPPQPPDPTRNLAMTGVVETDAGLKGLIKNVETGASVYAGVGDGVFDLRVTRIEAKRMTLARGGREYTLAMGSKEIPEETTRGASASVPASQASPRPGEGERRGPGFGPPGPGFGYGDMMRRLEENRSRMSPEQYDRARRYLDERNRSGGGYRGRGR